MSEAKYNVLFLGSNNSTRSIMAEAILNREGGGRFRAFSAGIAAGSELDRQTIDLLGRLHFDTSAMRPKNWNELAGDGGPTFDFVFTVCDDATMLPRAMWNGHPVFAHWGVADPTRAQGNEAQIRLAYADAFRMLSNRIMIFVNLPLRSLDLMSMQRKLDLIGNADKAQPAVVAA
jgi:protein-tyrosine-phosphatase